MRRTVCLILIFLILSFAAHFLGARAMADEKIYQMSGEIMAIELTYKTVVIEVPMGNNAFTVAGPLSQDAVLKKHGRPASLSDFAVRDQVRLTWMSTSGGHIIKKMQMLRAGSVGSEKIYQMRGEVTAIEPAHNTAVIEVPLGTKQFTVGGALSDGAFLKRHGTIARLTDFVVGDEVIVRWHATSRGHIIDEITAE